MRKERDALQKEVGRVRSCLARESEKLKRTFSQKERKRYRDKKLYSFFMQIFPRILYLFRMPFCFFNFERV